jgi:hypothetical protein
VINKRIVVRSQPGEILMRFYLENTQHRKRAVRVTQGVACLRSKSEALSSNPSTTERKKERKRKREREVRGSMRAHQVNQ